MGDYGSRLCRWHGQTRWKGTVIKRAISETILELPGYGERHTPVVLGESEDENLLGIVTLEIFGLVLDPFRRELRPARGLMKAMH